MNISNRQIINLYESGKTLVQIADIAGVSDETIRCRLKKLGVKRRAARAKLLNIDQNYFENIDTPDKAYFLGLLYADGYITGNKVKIKLKDKEILESFKSKIKSDHKLRTSFSVDKRTKKTYISHTLEITNPIFCAHFKKFNLTNSINKNYEFPKIKEEFYPHFIRGLFDGDGGISFKKKSGIGSTRCDIIMSEQMKDFIIPYLIKKTNISIRECRKVTKNNEFNIFVCPIGSPVKNFLDYIYNESDCSIRLKRKYEFYIRYLEYLKTPSGIRGERIRSGFLTAKKNKQLYSSDSPLKR